MKDMWREVPAGEDVPNVVNAVVEIPEGSKNKYEYSKDHGGFKLDRVLHSTVFYPGDYGFIPRTLYDDGDPLDVLVLVNEPTFPGCVIPVKPVALIEMNDGKENDDKILAIPVNDPNFQEIETKEDIPSHRLKEISHFFQTYKLLEGDEHTEVLGWGSKEKAKEAIKQSVKTYKGKYSWDD